MAELNRDHAAKLRRDASRADHVCTELLHALKELTKLSPMMSDYESDAEESASMPVGYTSGTPKSAARQLYPTGLPPTPVQSLRSFQPSPSQPAAWDQMNPSPSEV